MNKLEKSKFRTPYKPKDWLNYVDCYSPRCAIPVGPAFQADLPTFANSLCEYSHNPNTLEWLGVQSWPIEGQKTNTEEAEIGKGRLEGCDCSSPTSLDCVKRHVAEQRSKLKTYLGDTFWIWKFDEMGEEVSKSWTLKEQNKFENFIKLNPLSWDKIFSKPNSTSRKAFLSQHKGKRKEDFVKYYFNVYVPKRFSVQTRLHCKDLDTDDDSDSKEEDGVAKSNVVSYKPHRKRIRVGGV